jgi:ABC-type antimicrobial peptide transport system permease subunit
VLVGAGLIFGIGASLAGAKLLSSLVSGINPQMLLTLASMCGVLLVTGLLAAWWPARRAASTDPILALRTE